MKYLITGLGNIGREYEGTRHNIGFEVVDALAKKLEATWREDHHGSLAEGKYKGRTVILLKPNTYMNVSGKAIRYWLQKEKVTVENSMTICDDLNIAFGKQRMRAKGSDGGHNGLKSIQELLQTDAYPRLRVGIGSDFAKGKQVNFVLGKWTTDEQIALEPVIEKATQALLAFIAVGLDHAIKELGKPM